MNADRTNTAMTTLREALQARDPAALTGLVAALDRHLLRLAQAGLTPPHQACDGEEAALVGCALGIEDRDWVFWGRQVLVPGLLRGLDAAALFAGALDMGRTAQAIAAHRIVAMTSGPAARLPHATGLAWAAKRDGVVALAVLGDGAVSDPDFHVGLNFAGVMDAPVVFVVLSESDPAAGPEAPPAVIARGEGYGLPTIQVDGMDPEAVLSAVQTAAERARGGGGPTLIEARVRRGERVPQARLAPFEDAVEAALAEAERAHA